MVAKRSSRALALLLALPSAAFALGLGDIRLLSSLNAPLDAEIEVTDVAPDEVNTVQAQLAPRDTFAQNGLDYPNFLSSIQLRTVRTADGRQVIKLRSSDPISDPFITLLVQVSWSHGQLVREYTMLLDPPVYAPGQSAAANAPVAAPTTGSGTRAGSISRSAEGPAPAPAQSAAPAPEPAPPSAGPAEAPPASTPADATASAGSSSSSNSANATAAPAAPSAAPAAEDGAGTTHNVRRGETLSEIAAGVAGAKASTPRTRSWMVAIYQANPRAFEQNMNLLRSGSVLRIPDAAQAAAVSPSAASAEIHRQYAAWNSSRGGEPAQGSAAPASQPGRLRLVTPSEPASAGAAAGGANGAEVTQLQGRVHELEGQLAESKRLLDLKNADLARLQSQLAARQGANPTPPATPEAAQPPTPAPVTTAPAAPPPSEQNAPPAAPAQEQPPPAAQPPAAAPPAALKPAPVRKPTPAPPPAESGSILDTLMGYWWVLALIVLALIAVAVLRFVRSRRASEFDDSLGRLAVAGGGAASGGGVLGGGPGGRGFGSSDTAMRATHEEHPEHSVVVEETGTHERPRFVPAAGGAQAPAPKHVAADDTISSETAINLDQGDPLAEADFHMAYGLYDQAADLIRIAIGREPGRRDLKLKLLEVFFVWGNKEQFLQMAHELAQTRSEAAPGEWEKILIMGKQLAPEDPLFSSGAAISGATAGGVDLNLEGGESRVDFDLLGEPLPSDVPQGVDLDIGAAVGESEASARTDATTNVTDRNIALLESTLRDGSAATGSTRQMTAKMRRQNEQGDAEGPTVEQPSLPTHDASPTIRKKVETVLRQTSSADQTAELAIDDLGLDLGSVDTAEQPALGAQGADAPTLVTNLDEHSRRNLDDTAAEAHLRTSTTGQWQFEGEDLTRAGAMQDSSETSQLAALREQNVDLDLSGEETGTHESGGLDLDVGASTGAHQANGEALDLDVGTATVPDTAFAATQRLASEDLALPDLEPVTMSEVGTKLDLARAYMDMGDPDGARNILEEVLSEGSAAQKQEAQRLMESLPG
jgi:pilus assembly protein FimV